MVRPAKIRLFIDAPMAAGLAVPVQLAQANYLFAVMRLKLGDPVLVFNGRDGEWRAEVIKAGKRNGLLALIEQTKPQQSPPDVWLVFAPIKKNRMAFVIEKAVEMGAAKIKPVLTQYTNAPRLNLEKLDAYAMEAAEQCGATTIPDVDAPVSLMDMLDAWPTDRRLMFCDERRDALPAAEALRSENPGKWAILIGPEGGFSKEEVQCLKAQEQTLPVGLGPRVLRAETAVVAAMAAWQQALGDWR